MLAQLAQLFLIYGSDTVIILIDIVAIIVIAYSSIVTESDIKIGQRMEERLNIKQLRRKKTEMFCACMELFCFRDDRWTEVEL